jgi:anti-sigma regulatory factor (Ser/Thr protein kinase)/FixJ family two-component response regulator
MTAASASHGVGEALKSAVAPIGVALIGDDAQDLLSSADLLRTSGFRVRLIETPSALGDVGDAGATDADVVVLRQPMKLAQMVDLLESWNQREDQTCGRTIVQSRHHGSADRRQLIKAGAHYLLAMPVEDVTLSRVVRSALIDVATSESIQQFVASRKSAVGRMVSAVFEIRTLNEAEKLSSMLAMNYPAPEKVAVGIWELLSNAIEHGNLEIDYDEKTVLVETGAFGDEINRRLNLPQYADRLVRVEFERTPKAFHLRVIDEGAGFDHARFRNADPPTDRPNGRGILIARRLCFGRLTYRGQGNVVEAVIRA